MPKKGKKGDNTFRFQSFSEQISNVSIDVHRNARLTSKEIPENDKDTFFRESLEKWAELNCSLDYTKLYRKLKPLSRSFNQLVYHKDQVVEILKEYLSKDESLAHEACLELLAHMSKDLLDEFYPFFDQFFPLLVKFLGNNQNTKLIESTFICFAYIFKFLWKWMLKDLKNFFKTFSLLLSASQKHHIQVFASEAFAFLIRKSNDKPKVIKFLLEQIDCTLNEGVGHLLFQSVKGIKSQLNLAGEEVLMVILDTLYLVNNEKEEVMKALRVLWISILRHCSKENANILSKILYNSIENYFKSNKDDLETMQCFLLLLTEIVDFKNGDYIDTQHCLQVITDHLKKLNEDDIQELIQSLSAKLIKTINGNLTDDDIVNFINDYANLFSKDTRKPLQLYRQLLNWYKIDLIKPSILSFISKHFKNVDKGGDFLEFLVEFVYNVDPRGKLCRPIEQQTINESILDFERRKGEKHFHSRVIEGLNIELWSDNPGFFWCSAVVLMHTRFEPTKKDLCDISELAKEILDKLDESLSTHHLLALCYLVACFQLVKAKSEAVCEDLPLKKMTELVRLHPSSEHCLQAFDVYVSTSSECSSEESSTIMNILKENLNSPFKLNRILTLRIFDSLQAKSTIESDVFKNCLVAEEIEVTLNTYRDRMMHLQKLTFRQDTTLPPDQIMECVLRYLIGNFYLNFSLVWEPTTKVILSYMGEEHDKTNQLWTVWMEILNNITEFCENPKHPFTKDDEERNLSETYLTFYNVFRIEKTEYRPDYQNFRYLMWKAMSDFASVVERRSRFVMPLFFQFVENEYTQADELYSRTQNVSKEKQVINHQEPRDKETIKKHNKRKTKTLCAQLDVYKQFKDPKSISKEKRLFQFYMEFLSHKEHDVQQKTLQCLQTYKFPYLKPYQEDFEKLMDDTTFREELVKICSIDEPVFKEDHKEHLMPIVIRLLYGKLQRKSGLGMSGKSSLMARRNIIMQFLAQCNNNEIKTFISLITDPLKLYKDMEIISSVENQSLAISAIVPLQRQISFCNMFSTLVTRLQKQAMYYLPELFHLMLKIVWSNSWCLEHKKEEIWPHYLGRMKELRTLGIMKLIELFTTIPEFDCQESIDEIFTSAVWPKLAQLPTESCQNSTPLFQLVECWSKNSRYFQLLSKENENGLSLISQLFEVLRQNALTNDMEKKVMIIIQNLLKSEAFEESEEKGKLLTTGQSFNKEETIGIQIVKPYVANLLQHFYGKLHSKMSNVKLKTKQKIGNIIPHIQLSILADVSKFVTDADLCEKLIDIFLPVLHCVASEEVQFNIVTTVQNLLPQTTPTERHLSLFPPLFSCFHGNKPRDMLCKVYIKMSEPYPEIARIAKYVNDLNSWDAKRLEEPDYERRLAAYRGISDSFEKEAEKWSVDHILPILNNCFFFVDHSNDMSLRDASSSCIEAVFQMVSRKLKAEREAGHEGSGTKLFEDVVVKCILPSIMQGLKLKNSVPRHEHIHFLEVLIKTFDHRCLSDLKELTTDDPETDFFQNIKHVQMHRRIRAIHQLTSKCGEGKLSNKSLYNYLLPMITHFIHDNLSKSKDHNLLTATIEGIGAIVNGFPWSKYANVLKHYLSLLQKERFNQKTYIRVVVVVLNNFPFDLSNVIIEEQILKKSDGKKDEKPGIKGSHEKPQEDNKDKDESKETENETEKIVDMEEEEINEEEMEETNGDEISTRGEVKPRTKQVDQKSAEQICQALSTRILPQLHRFFTKKSRVESFHKKSNNHAEDGEDILKVPVAFAIVKLLQHLPKSTLMSNLSGILLRVSQSLKSQARDVRDIARDTLKKIAASLGSSYLSQVFSQMKSVLQRGYQLHVLGYTVHSILENMQNEMKGGDLDNCVALIMQIVCEELFGTVAEEKTIQGIVVKLFEAKSKKSNDLIEIVSTFITSGSFATLIGPLKEVLDTTQDHKTRRKVEEAFRRVSVGLLHNTGVSPEDHLLFIHGTISNTVSTLFEKRKNKKAAVNHINDADKMNHPSIVREDIYLMPDKPTRSGVAPSVSKFTNEHVLIEFGLQQLHTGLKRSKFTATNDEHCRMLDPFIEILVNSLTSKHTRLVTLTMRCVALLVKFSLPALKVSMPEITKQIFKLIKKYARAGSAKGDNFEMIMTSFKTMTIIIRDGKEHKVSTKQLQILMTYVEEDIYDSSRQATALPLLKAILMRRLASKEIADTMDKIEELSIRDDDNSIRAQCRQLMTTYLIEYPLGKKMSKHFDFYISNLSYEEETGRISSLEMFAVMFNKFPYTVLQEYSTYFFIPLVMMLINDESALCKKMAASAVKLLINKLGVGSPRNDLFDITLNWSKQNKVQLRQVAMQLFGTFIDVEQDTSNNDNFKTRLDQMVPVLLKTIQDGVKADQDDDESSEDESEAEDNENEAENNINEDSEDHDGAVQIKKLPMNDKCLYNTLTCVGKIFTKIPGIFTTGADYKINEFLAAITELLLHSHAWVRLSSSQLFAVYFSSIPVEEIANTSSNSYLSIDTQAKVKDLCLIFYEQLKDDQLTKEIADQATKNLIYLFKIVKFLNGSEPNSNTVSNNNAIGDTDILHDDEEIQNPKKNINIKVLIVKMTRLATFEALKKIKESVKRTCVFRWIAAVCLDSDHQQLLPHLPDLLKPLYREISNAQKEESDLVKLAHEVLELIRGQFDKQTFAEVYAKVQKMAHEKRDSRKRKLAVEAVKEPEKFAARKQKLNLAKREQKKRKLYERKPELKFKKIRSQKATEE